MQGVPKKIKMTARFLTEFVERQLKNKMGQNLLIFIKFFNIGILNLLGRILCRR